MRINMLRNKLGVKSDTQSAFTAVAAKDRKES